MHERVASTEGDNPTPEIYATLDYAKAKLPFGGDSLERYVAKPAVKIAFVDEIEDYPAQRDIVQRLRLQLHPLRTQSAGLTAGSVL